MNCLGIFFRYIRTLRHLRVEQLFYLFLRRILGYPRRVRTPGDRPRAIEPECRPTLVPVRGGRYRAPATFSFLNRTVDFGEAVDWEASGQVRLWLYNLHYFDWLRDPSVAVSDVRHQLAHWIRSNPPFAGAGWEPYPTSLRLVNLIVWVARHGVDDEIGRSIALQSAWLNQNLERHLQANHLFVNIKALVFSAWFLDGEHASNLRAGIPRLLQRELEEQFCDDGGHYERSPMYHLLLTQDLLELCMLSSTDSTLLGRSLNDELRWRARSALDFANWICREKGSVPRFNDSTDGVAPSLQDLNDYAATCLGYESPVFDETVSAHHFRDSGMVAIRSQNDQLLIDCGNVGPDHQPGHAHCDLFSFELVIDNNALLVNCGVSDYEDTATRQFARCTAGHNTLVLDGNEQSEMWGAFRVGRRARPADISFEEVDDGWCFHGSHDGYQGLSGNPRHAREIKISKVMGLQVHDRVSGAGEHYAEVWLHAAEGCAFELNGRTAILALGGKSRLRVEGAPGLQFDVVKTPRYPQFGLVEEGSSLRISAKQTAPFEMSYKISRYA